MTVLGPSIPFFLGCHGMYGVLAEKVVVPGTGANSKDGSCGTGGIESSRRCYSFCSIVGG